MLKMTCLSLIQIQHNWEVMMHEQNHSRCQCVQTAPIYIQDFQGYFGINNDKYIKKIRGTEACVQPRSIMTNCHSCVLSMKKSHFNTTRTRLLRKDLKRKDTTAQEIGLTSFKYFPGLHVPVIPRIPEGIFHSQTRGLFPGLMVCHKWQSFTLSLKWCYWNWLLSHILHCDFPFVISLLALWPRW